MLKFLLAALLFVAPATAQVAYPYVSTVDFRGNDMTLDSNGNATWDFTSGGTAQPFAGVPDVVHMPKAVDTSNPIICNFMSVTRFAVTVHCWRTNVSGLLNGLLQGPISGGIVHLTARYKP